MIWEVIEAIASTVTATGVFIGAIQLLLTKRINQTQFEDDLTKQYREITKMISVKALLGGELTTDEFEEDQKGLYHYIDLSNERVFLRKIGRVSQATWEYWRDGIKSNLSRAAFKQSWDQVKVAAPNSFSELRRLEKSDFKVDPTSW
jgi:hypothetical protein